MRSTKEYEEGRTAYDDGEDYTVNPYAPNSSRAISWDMGWDDAEEDETYEEENEEY
jgi:hypothetical protein